MLSSAAEPVVCTSGQGNHPRGILLLLQVLLLRLGLRPACADDLHPFLRLPVPAPRIRSKCMLIQLERGLRLTSFTQEAIILPSNPLPSNNLSC